MDINAPKFFFFFSHPGEVVYINPVGWTSAF